MDAASTGAKDEAKRTAQRVAHSKTLERTARLGFLSRGFVYIFIGVIAVQIALGSGRGEEADQKGAFNSLASTSWGVVLLWLVVLGFLGYAAWRIAEATLGHLDEPAGSKRVVERVTSGVKAVIYLGLAFTAAKVASGGSGGKEGDSWSAEVMKHTGGRWLLGAVGLVIAAVGAYLVVKALRNDYAEDLETGRMGPTFRRAALALGRAGYAARGVAFAVLGVLVVLAAVNFDPKQAEGLDTALKTLAKVPFGSVVLTVVGLGLIAFGCYSLVEARYRRVAPS